eukprot:m.77667 g.77667  ORF g.77667 m.77667 type:complete len:59 (-) comp20692_c0_seq7:1163-1339(-)
MCVCKKQSSCLCFVESRRANKKGEAEKMRTTMRENFVWNHARELRLQPVFSFTMRLQN